MKVSLSTSADFVLHLQFYRFEIIVLNSNCSFMISFGFFAWHNDYTAFAEYSFKIGLH